MPENFFIKHYAAMLELKPKARKTVKVTAAIIRNQNRIFATQRGYGEFKDGWEFPGGNLKDSFNQGNQGGAGYGNRCRRKNHVR